MLDKLCLVMDIDETMVHYIEDTTNPYNNFVQDTGLFNEEDKLLHRPRLGAFFDYVKKYSPDNVFRTVNSDSSSSATPMNNKSIIIGIWTYGNKSYASKVAKLLKDRYGIIFDFIYSREDMSSGMYDKELEYILEKHGSELNIEKQNIYLVDNCPSNIYHSKNINNGILVTSFVGHNIDRRDTMFDQLIDVCEELLHKDKVSNKHKNKFTLNGVPTNIISIGRNGMKTWDSDDTCRLYLGGQRTLKKSKQYTRKQNNKKRIYKTGHRQRWNQL